jgi:phosphoesterase RecJ-like protein
MGIIMTEEKKGMLSVSIRSRSKIDVSKIAVELGGGGHFYAAGAVVELPYEKAVDKVIEVAKKYAEKID